MKNVRNLYTIVKSDNSSHSIRHDRPRCVCFQNELKLLLSHLNFQFLETFYFCCCILLVFFYGLKLLLLLKPLLIIVLLFNRLLSLLSHLEVLVSAEVFNRIRIYTLILQMRLMTHSGDLQIIVVYLDGFNTIFSNIR